MQSSRTSSTRRTASSPQPTLRVTPDNYAYAVALNWSPPYRVERINKLLAGRTGLTPADMLAIQDDIHSEFDLVVSQRLAYALDHASPTTLSHDKARLKQAADFLRAWNGEVSINAAAPAIVDATRRELWPMLLYRRSPRTTIARRSAPTRSNY